jgi:hypothetical protein
VTGSLSTVSVSGGRGEEDREARRWSPNLCDRIAVAGGPAVRRWGRGSRLTGWVEEIRFFFIFFFSPGGRAVIWSGLGVDRRMGGRAVGFFFLFWNVGTVVRGLLTSTKFQFFCIFLLLADVSCDNWWA